MFKDDIFDEWLDSESKRVLEKFKQNEQLSIEDKMILTLKAQTNHFAHLDIEIREEIEKSRKLSSEEIKAFRDEQNKKWDEQNKKWDEQNKKWDEQNKKWDENQKELKDIRNEMNKIYQSINNQTWKMIGAVGLIVILGKLIDSFGN